MIWLAVLASGRRAFLAAENSRAIERSPWEKSQDGTLGRRQMNSRMFLSKLAASPADIRKAGVES
jgi:hypothetical protein